MAGVDPLLFPERFGRQGPRQTFRGLIADRIGAEGRFGWFWNATACTDVLCDRLPVNIQLPSDPPLRPALFV